MAAVEDPWQDEQKTLESVLPKNDNPETQEDPEIGMNNIDETKNEATQYSVEKEKDGLRPTLFDMIQSNESEQILGMVEDFRMNGEPDKIDLIVTILQELVQRDMILEGENLPQIAQQTIDQIQEDNKAHLALETVMPEGKFDEGKLMDQILLLTESSEGARPLSKLFALFEQIGNQEVMQKMINMLMVMKAQPGQRSENALAVLDRISVFEAQNPAYKQMAEEALTKTSETVSLLEAKLQEAPQIQVSPGEAGEEMVQAEPNPVPSETEAEILARRELFKKANEGVADELEAERLALQVKNDETIRTNKFDPNMNYQERKWAEEAYKERQAIVAAEAEEAAEMTEKSNDKSLTGDPELDKLFLNRKEEAPVVVAKNEDKTNNPTPEASTADQIKPEKVASVTEVVPPKSETRVSRPAQAEVVKPEMPSQPEPLAVNMTDEELKARNEAEARKKSKGGIKIKMNANDPLDGLT